MKTKLFLCYFMLLLFFVLPVRVFSSEKKVIVDLELETLPNTLKYEIEVKKTTEQDEKAVPFSQQEPKFKLKLKVGNYVVRTRVVTTDSQTSAWSDWSELLAKPEEVELTEPKASHYSLQKNQSQAQFDINWSKAEGADRYIVWVEDTATKKIIKKESANSSVKLTLNKGEYKIGVQSISKEGVKSETRYFNTPVYVADAYLPTIDLQRPSSTQFKWNNQKLAAVQIEILRKAFFADNYEVISSLKEEGDQWSLPKDLKPGEYKLQFQYVSDFYLSGPKKEVFFVKKPTELDFKNLQK